MSRVLVVANRTVAGRKLLEAIQERSGRGDAELHLVVPLAAPRHGNVIYDDAQRDAAQVRIDLAAAFLRQRGIEISGEIGDEDPLTAIKDALASFPADEIIVSTLPHTRSGWLRRDLIERIEEETGKPVLHITTDPEEEEGLAVKTTLVVANRTAGGEQLLEVLKRQHQRDDDRLFLVVIPLEGRGGRATGIARQRLRNLTGSLRQEGMTVSGMIGDPDPYDAIMNTLDLFLSVDEIVISTLPETKSGWLRSDLISRVQNATRANVDHVVQEEAAKV
jgi:hypothetical protein